MITLPDENGATNAAEKGNGGLWALTNQNMPGTFIFLLSFSHVSPFLRPVVTNVDERQHIGDGMLLERRPTRRMTLLGHSVVGFHLRRLSVGQSG